MCARCANRSNPPGHVQLLGSQKGWRLWFTSGSGVTLLLGNSAAISLPTQFYGHRCPAPGLAPREDRGAPRGRACATVCGARRQCRVSRSDTGQHGSTHHDTIDTGVNRQRLDRVPPRHTSAHLRDTLTQDTSGLNTPRFSPRGSPKGYRSGVPRLSSSPVVPREHAEDRSAPAHSPQSISLRTTALGLARARR